MQLNGKVLAGFTSSFQTKKGETLNKTRLKVLDTGDEAGDDLNAYWVDLLGDAALSDDDIEQIRKQEVVIEIRRASASLGKNGTAYLNLTGGAVLFQGMPVQSKLLKGAGRRSA
jgi:hypothetical protein